MPFLAYAIPLPAAPDVQGDNSNSKPLLPRAKWDAAGGRWPRWTSDAHMIIIIVCPCWETSMQIVILIFANNDPAALV